MTNHAISTPPQFDGRDSAVVGTGVATEHANANADAVSFYWPSFSWYWFDTGALVRET